MQWLEASRAALRNKQVRLCGQHFIDEREKKAIEAAVEGEGWRIEAYLDGQTPQTFDAFYRAAMHGFRRSIGRTIDAVQKNQKRNGLELIDFHGTQEMHHICSEYRSLVDFVIDHSKGLTLTTFSRAAIITPYWSAEKLEEELAAEKVEEHLQARGYDYDVSQIEDKFSNIQLRAALSSPSSPFKPCADRVIRAIKSGKLIN